MAVSVGGVLLLLVMGACDLVERVRGDRATTAGGLALGMEAPGALRPGGEGIIRVSVTNRGEEVASGFRLELVIPEWVEAVLPEPSGKEVTMVASPDEGTRLSYRVDDPPLQPGETQTVTQRVRIPAGAVGGESAPRGQRLIRARLVGGDGRPLGAEIESELVVEGSRPSDTVATRAGTQPEVGEGTVLIGREQVGPVRLGMPASELRQRAPAVRDTTWTAEGTRERGLVVPVAEGRQVTALLQNDTVARITVADTALRTREGLGVGSRLEELRSAYGRTCADMGEGRVVVWFPNLPGISFALDARPPERTAELRENPDRIPGSARVTQLWLRRGADRC